MTLVMMLAAGSIELPTVGMSSILPMLVMLAPPVALVGLAVLVVLRIRRRRARLAVLEWRVAAIEHTMRGSSRS